MSQQSGLRPRKRFKRLAKFAARGVVVLLGLVFGLVVGLEMIDRTVLIEEISVPEELAQQGYTPSVVAYRILTELKQIDARATTTRTRPQVGLSNTQVEVTLPVGANISLSSIIAYFRSRFGYPQTRLRGGIVVSDSQDPKCAVAGCYTFFVNIDGRQSYFFSSTYPKNEVRELIHETSLGAVARLDPYLLANYFFACSDVQEPNHYQRARAYAEIALRQAPPDDDAWAMTLLGMIQNQSHNWQAATSYFDLVLTQRPGFAPALNSRCWARAHIQGRAADAVADCRAALAQNPRSYETFDSLAVAFAETGQQRPALVASRCAIQLGPEIAHLQQTYDDLHQRFPSVSVGSASDSECASLYRS
jgi:hypothetical protein